MLEKAAGSSLTYATGTVTETANRKRFGVQVEIAIFDRAGRLCGTAKDYQSRVEPGARWTFRALVTQKEAASARVTAVREGN